MKFGREIVMFWLASGGIRPMVRGVLYLVLGALLFWEPMLARKILIWIPILIAGGGGAWCLWRSSSKGTVKYRHAWLTGGLMLWACGVVIWMQPENRMALICAATLVLLSVLGAAKGALRSGATWQDRVIGGVAAILGGVLSGLVVMRKAVDFLPAADLIGIFLLATGVLTLAQLKSVHRK